MIDRAPAENQVLFIGNSFTQGGSSSVATIFDRLAIAGGHDDPTTVMRAVGGQGYDFHIADAGTQSEIVSRPWTHVVMQNYSTRPTHIGNVSAHLANGTQLYEQIMANNAATQVVLYQTWSRAANHSLITGTSTPSSFESTAEMQSELRDNYRALADALNGANPGNPPVAVGPVGDAWENAGGLRAASHPGFVDLHGGDNYHGNDNGYYMAAAVFYSVIYGSSPEGLHTHSAVTSLGLSLTEDAGMLGRVAWETTAGNVELEFVAQPVSLTVPENQPAQFSVEVIGSAPYTVQWSRDGTPVAGAESLLYEIAAAGAGLGGSEFTVTVTNSVSTITSDAATLTIVTDSDPPVIEGGSSPDGASIELQFSEPIAAADPLHYMVANRGERIEITAAQLSPDGRRVTLILEEEIAGRFVVVVAPDPTDLSGNPIAAGTYVVGSAPDGSELELFVDFGSSGVPTNSGDDPPHVWNNVTQSIGGSDSGAVADLLGATGAATGIDLRMVSSFNGANASGTQSSALFPSTASRDSLFGNTELFSGRADVFPAFRFTGLDPSIPYSITFYASRNGVSDNRSTNYKVTGAAVTDTVLDPANNSDSIAQLEGLLPSGAGELLVELSPAPANNNSNHFTYLGALALSAVILPVAPPELYTPVSLGGHLVLDWQGAAILEASTTLEGAWETLAEAPVVETWAMGPRRFYRLSFEVP